MFSAKTKIILVLLGCVYAGYHFFSTLHGQWHFIDNVDLMIHEAGHMVFFPFGEFISVLGGSLLQILIPILFIFYFRKTKQNVSSAVMFLWVSVNLFYVGMYASDAIRMELPLLGGDGVIHDWNYLLTSSGLLKHTKLVSDLLYFTGWICIFLSAYIAFTQADDSKRKSPVKSTI